MTTELEKEFFQCFGIERKRNDKVTLEAISGGVLSANLSQEPFYVYPQITDRILLKLICILSKTLTYVMLAYNIDELKQYVLGSCVRYSESIDKHQVQAIFEGE